MYWGKHWSKDGLHVVGVANSHADGRAIVSCASRYTELLSRRLGVWFPGTCVKKRQNGSAIVPSIYQLKRNRSRVFDYPPFWKRYPMPGSVRMWVGCAGSASILRRSCVTNTRNVGTSCS
jgi:hypothetical protein